MSTTISEKLYTVPEFLEIEWDEDDDNEYELIGGRIVAKPRGGTSGKHGDIVMRIGTRLNNFAGEAAGEKRIGLVYGGGSTNLGRPQGFSYVEPDVCFVIDGRTPKEFEGAIPVAPDLVIEVWSPSDSTKTIQDKIEAYQQAGVPLIWSIYMVNKYVLVYHLNDPDIKLLNLKDELDGEDVIPGFKLKVNTLFQ